MGAQHLPGSAMLDAVDDPPKGVHLDDTGDKRLKKLDPVLKDLRALGELYERWQRCGASKNRTVAQGCWDDQPTFGSGKEESDELRKLRTSNFGYIYGAYSRIDSLHSAGKELDKTCGNTAGELAENWKGKSGNAAGKKISALQQSAQSYFEGMESIGGHVMGLWKTMTNSVDNLAKFADGKQAKTIADAMDKLAAHYVAHVNFMDSSGEAGDASPASVMGGYIDQIELALRNGLVHAESHILRDTAVGVGGGAAVGAPVAGVGAVAGAVIGGVTGLATGIVGALQDPEPSSDPGGVRIDGNGLRQAAMCKLDGGRGDWWSNEVCMTLDQFADDYYAVISDLRKRITQTTRSVDDGLGQFTERITGLAASQSDPFGDLVEPADEPGSQDHGHGPGRDDGHSPGSTGPSSHSPSGQATPGLPHARGPLPSQVPGTDDPGQDQPGGFTHWRRSPDDSQQGSAHERSTPGDGQRESVTVGHGDEKITMSSADGSGQMRLTVDDGDGEPKSYNVDFGQGGAPTAGAADTGVPDTGVPGSGDGQDAEGGTDAGEHVAADGNGHAVIHDGDETISVDRAQDGSGEITVTVDGGDGEPTTYTMDMGDSGTGDSGTGDASSAAPATGGPAAAEAAPATGAPSGGAPSGAGADPSGAAAAAVPDDGGTAGAAAGEPVQPGAQSAAVPENGGGTGQPTHAEPAAASASGSPGAGQGGGRGMPMMGGMGGAGGGKGGDSERGASQWRTSGDLFDDVGTVDAQTGLRPVDGVIGDTAKRKG